MLTERRHWPHLVPDIIDDDLEFCALIQEYLSGCGCQVAAAHTGPDGVAMVMTGILHQAIAAPTLMTFPMEMNAAAANCPPHPAGADRSLQPPAK